MGRIIITDSDDLPYKPIGQGPIAKVQGFGKYFDDNLGRWVYIYTGPNFYEIDDVKQGRELPRVKKTRKKEGRPP